VADEIEAMAAAIEQAGRDLVPAPLRWWRLSQKRGVGAGSDPVLDQRGCGPSRGSLAADLICWELRIRRGAHARGQREHYPPRGTRA